MATYLELRELMDDGELHRRVAVAIIVVAEQILQAGDTTDPPFNQTAGDHDIRVQWARRAFASPIPEAQKFLMSILAANKDQTPESIQGVSDAVIQTKVDEVVDLMAGVVI